MVAFDVRSLKSGQTLVRVRRGKEQDSMPLDCATEDVLRSADPYRAFRSYRGQRHYSGLYYSATERRHVGYESRLEGTRALFADFAPGVNRCISQPFQLCTRIGRDLCTHIPDYLLLSDSGLTVVAVKPKMKLEHPKVAATFRWVRDVVESAGWTFEVYSEPDPVRLANVRFFAGFRRPESVSPRLLGELRSHNLVGLTFGEAQHLIDGPAPRVRAALLHMLWNQEVRIDLSQMLCQSTILNKGVQS